MMIGPAPMIRMLSMSVLLGMGMSWTCARIVWPLSQQLLENSCAIRLLFPRQQVRDRAERNQPGSALLPSAGFRRAELILQPPQHEMVEAVKQPLHVMRSGAGLGVPLETERRFVLEGDPLQGPVE